ncbi:MAG: aldehyde dehydrogenase, partial [Pedobacter sp.]
MNVAINGFGRIGRIFLRTALEQNINVVAINDLGDPATLAHLFKYDTVHRAFKGEVSYADQHLAINGKWIRVLNQPDPAKLPWKELRIDLVIEATGRYITRADAGLHLQAGAKQVIISAPSPDKDVPIVVLGVNEHEIDLQSPILSNASCTTNNVAPMVKILNDNWGVLEGYI